MPKRVIDFDALWASDKLASCAEWAQSEYAWLYGLADASGSFELTNLRVIWGRVAAIRKNLTLERLGEIFDEFIARGLLFTWEESGKRYGHWTGSDVPGRLPPPSWRMRLEKLAPPVPRQALAAYSAGFGGSREAMALGANVRAGAAAHAVAPAPFAAVSTRSACTNPQDAHASGLKAELEAAQAQDWDLDLNLDLEKEVSPPQHTQNRSVMGTPVFAPQHIQKRDVLGTPLSPPQQRQEQPLPEDPLPPVQHSEERRDAASQALPSETPPEELLAIYEAERGALPPAHVLTAERRVKCAQWLAAGFTPDDFRAAVRRAAATPFLAGAGARGWRVSFDWLIADPGNARKVLQGEYAPGRAASQPASEPPSRQHSRRSRGERHVLADLYAGTGPRPADCGVRVNPAVLERLRAREARLALGAPGAQVDAQIGAQVDAEAGAAERESPPQPQPRLQPSFGDVPGSAPQRVACTAQARASPAAMKS